MRTFDVYKHRTQGYEAVKQGFSWPGFFIQWIWALVKRLWLHAIVLLIVTIIVQSAIDVLRAERNHPGAVLVVNAFATIGLGVVVGSMGNQWRSKSLIRRGFEHIRTVDAETPDAAIDIIAREENGTDTGRQCKMNRPTSVTVLGLLNLVLAGVLAFGIYGVAFEQPVPQVVKDNAVLMTVMYLIISLRFVGLIMLFLAGIGLLQLKPWGRYLAIVYSGYIIVIGFFGFLYTVHVNDLIGELLHSEVLVFAASSECVGIIYPALLLLFMFRPTIVTAFGPRHDDHDNTPFTPDENNWS